MRRLDTVKLPFFLADGQSAGILKIVSRYPSMIVQLEADEILGTSLPSMQLIEEQVYEYEFRPAYSGFRLRVNPPLTASKMSNQHEQRGIIETGSYVGTLRLQVEDSHSTVIAQSYIESRSSKIDYLSDFRLMLDGIAQKSIDLLLSHKSTFLASLVTDSFESNVTPQQRLFFLRSIVSDAAFKRALNQVVRFPHNRLEAKSESMRFSRTAAPGRALLTQMLTRPNRLPIPDSHPLREKLSSIPREVHGLRKFETFDTAENRFVKHALRVFAAACKQIENSLLMQKRLDNTLLLNELFEIKTFLQQTIDEDFFKDVGILTYIPAGSPVLQRKQGYKNVLTAWHRFNSALKLSWPEADLQFFGGQKNMALLYEYWCFLQVLEVFCELASLEPESLKSIIHPTPDGFSLDLKKGKTSAIWGTCSTSTGRFNCKLTYQPRFVPSLSNSSNSTWSKNMQPDMTISFFPDTYPADDAGEASAADWDELRYFHLDAKYKIRLPFATDDSTGFKFDDIDKMHAYNDAINHSIGAVILYPGDVSQVYRHLSGKNQVGAIALAPGSDEQGKTEIAELLKSTLQASFA